MFRIIQFQLLWAILGPFAHAIEPHRLLLEASPSAGLAGDLQLRGEFLTDRDWRIATQLEYATYQSPDVSDASDIRFDSSAQYYPNLFRSHGPYFGIGAQLRNHTQSFQKRRPRRTYFQPNSFNDMDRWTVQTMSVSLTQSLGYRLNMGELLTTSIGLEAAEKLHSVAEIRDQQLLAGEGATVPQYPVMVTRVMMNIGFLIP